MIAAAFFFSFSSSRNRPRSTSCSLTPGYLGSSTCGAVPSAALIFKDGTITPSSEAGSDEQKIRSQYRPRFSASAAIFFSSVLLPVPGPPLTIHSRQPSRG